jgi:hypothetical protein
MSGVGVLALVANGVCFALLWRHRAEDINMRSVWLCSRNDLIANVSVLFAALAVWLTLSPWPDIVVGALICGVFLRSAFLVAREAHAELVLKSRSTTRCSGRAAIGAPLSGSVGQQNDRRGNESVGKAHRLTHRLAFLVCGKLGPGHGSIYHSGGALEVRLKLCLYQLE